MRTLMLLSLIGMVSFCVETAAAQQAGDRMVVITENAPLRMKNETTGTVPRGTVIGINTVNGDWFWVISSGSHDTAKGWISRSDVMPVAQALDYFNDEVTRNPTAASYTTRGMIWYEKDVYDHAVSDFDEALRLDPQYAPAYVGRANARRQMGELDKASNDYNEALRFDPKNVAAYTGGGYVRSDKGEYEKAISDFNEAIHLDPKNGDPWNGKAWIAATCPDTHFRDGKKAVEDATKACELGGWRNWDWLDTLAAACAETGDYRNAIKWQEKAIELAPAEERPELQSRLALFKSSKPYRERPGK